MVALLTGDRAKTVDAGRTVAAIGVGATLKAGAIIRAADAVVTHHLRVAIGVGGAPFKAIPVDAGLAAQALAAALTRRARRGVALAGAFLAGVAMGAVGVVDAIVMTETLVTTFLQPALCAGDTDLIDHLARSIQAGFAGLAIQRRAAGARVGRAGAAPVVTAGLAAGAIIAAVAAKLTLTAGAIGARRAIGIAAADPVIYAASVFAALASGACLGAAALGGFTRVGRRVIRGVVSADIGEASVGRPSGSVRIVIFTAREGLVGIVGVGRGAHAAPADAVVALGVVGAASGAMSVKAGRVAAAFGVRRTGDLAGAVGADAAGAAFLILVAASADDAAPLMADFVDRTVELRGTLRHTGAVSRAELRGEAIRVGLTAHRRDTRAIIAASRRAIAVHVALTSLHIGHAIAPGTAHAFIAVSVAAANRHAFTTPADVIAGAFLVVDTNRGARIGRVIGVVITPRTTRDENKRERCAQSKPAAR